MAISGNDESAGYWEGPGKSKQRRAKYGQGSEPEILAAGAFFKH